MLENRRSVSLLPLSRTISAASALPLSDVRSFECMLGVNHYEVCHPLTEKYLDLLRTNRVSVIRCFLTLDCGSMTHHGRNSP